MNQPQVERAASPKLLMLCFCLSAGLVRTKLVDATEMTGSQNPRKNPNPAYLGSFFPSYPQVFLKAFRALRAFKSF